MKMSEAKQLPKRQDLPKSMTWDLSKIFVSDESFEAAFRDLKEKLTKAQSYQGSLNKGAASFLAAIEYFLEVYRQLETLYVYSSLKNDQDTSDATYQALNARAGALLTQASEALSFFEPELLTLSDETIWDYFSQEPKLEIYRHFIEQIVAQRPHV